MKLFDIKKLTFEYFRRDEDGDVSEVVEALKSIDLSVKKGDFISIVGGNGSGKSTLAKHLNALLFPTGGQVVVDGMSTDDDKNILPVRKKVGMIFQNPEDQFVSSVVEEDIAFGPENIGMPSAEIEEAIEGVLKLLDIETLKKRDPLKLSGGQKKKVAIAGALVMKPDCLVLDEATSMLSETEREELLLLLKKLNSELGMTIINITHNMSELAASDIVIAMNEGRVEFTGKPDKLFNDIALMEKCRLSLSPEKKAELDELVNINSHIGRDDTFDISEALIFDKVSFSYDGRVNVLEDISLALHPGETLGICGHTGSGKSTLLKLANGLLTPTDGTIYYKNKDITEKDYDKAGLRKHVSLVFQFPEHQLFEESVIKDVTFGPYNLDISRVEAEKRAFKALADMGLPDTLYDISPLALSGGTKRKVAIAGVLAMEPDILLLDEPGAGLDPVSRMELFILLKKLQRDRGMCIVLVSHDEAEIEMFCDRVIRLERGTILE
ncbi:MAG: ATP-binding cassette domain-containing protein [Lachnospiraceae bacterium]|nr:ATP-binding cassette domain-containing protein [Lachnospiraceae bacterium]